MLQYINLICVIFLLVIQLIMARRQSTAAAYHPRCRECGHCHPIPEQYRENFHCLERHRDAGRGDTLYIDGEEISTVWVTSYCDEFAFDEDFGGAHG